ncbi:acyl-CoA carboxylase subunit epsilon [Actinomadura viridis]|uniref:acyl-CoA carboxylase subunit epsilon n=1 Tax=Actinomadura viridis TaxID=58110 RepID=UPI0036806D00
MSTTGKPFLQIVRGDPTPEEIAALVAVLTARAQAHAAASTAGPSTPSRWADRSRLTRGPVSEGLRPRGPGAWRASAYPR